MEQVLSTLSACKDQLDQAMETMDVARTLNRKIEAFEVILFMVPSRSNKVDAKQMLGVASGVAQSDEEETSSSAEDDTLQNVKSTIVGKVITMIQNIGPLGESMATLLDIFQTVSDVDASPIVRK